MRLYLKKSFLQKQALLLKRNDIGSKMFSWFRKKSSEETTPENIGDNNVQSQKIQEDLPEKTWFETLKNGLFKTSQKILSPFQALLRQESLSEEETRELRKNLIEADLGTKIVADILAIVKNQQEKDTAVSLIKDTLLSLCLDPPDRLETTKVLLLVGVNGAGKTTTCAKIASLMKSRQPLLVAADTYRAAAVEQLQKWAQREGFNCYADDKTTCPAAVVYQGLEQAKQIGSDLTIVDTSGRLHTSKNLMQELEKVKKVALKSYESPHITTLLVLDAAQGQNMLRQVEEFDKSTQIDGLVVTKIDGTSKAGAIFNIMSTFKKPVYFLGCGERIDDLQHFSKKEFVEALFQEPSE